MKRQLNFEGIFQEREYRKAFSSAEATPARRNSGTKWNENRRSEGPWVIENMVARDGIEPHYKAWKLPAAGIVLDPRLPETTSFSAV
jgi:hypothetical protein